MTEAVYAKKERANKISQDRGNVYIKRGLTQKEGLWAL